MKKIRVYIVVDTPGSWMNSYSKEFVEELNKREYDTIFCSKHEQVGLGDVAVFLSCEQLIRKSTMEKNKHNLVVHAGDLPKGKGWSPITWQVLEGKNSIPICIFEAVEKVDAGPIYFKDHISLEGHELLDEIRKKLVEKTFELVCRFLEAYPNVNGKAQEGKSTYYRKRTPADSVIDINKKLNEQFNLLRIVDNEKYPAYFEHMEKKYILKIYKKEND